MADSLSASVVQYSPHTPALRAARRRRTLTQPIGTNLTQNRRYETGTHALLHRSHCPVLVIPTR